jgi:hypothetical protein|tara:strand:- start:330 stop:431 length:102 start_codon:yes stop_codon:yes gene_type:complete
VHDGGIDQFDVNECSWREEEEEKRKKRGRGKRK